MPCGRADCDGVGLSFIQRIIPHFVQGPKPDDFLDFVQDLKLNGFSRFDRDLKPD
jgi:hypothetical protein